MKTIPMNTDNWVYTNVQGDTVLLKNNVINQDAVPDVTGMTLKDAIFILENQGLAVKVIGSGGRVRKQSLRVGRAIRAGDMIYITMG